MYSTLRSSLGILACCALAGCVSPPPGPSVMALPRDGVDFDQFVAAADLCRQWAERRIGIAPQQVAEQHAIAGAVIGSAVGAAAGAAKVPPPFPRLLPPPPPGAPPPPPPGLY